MPDTTDTDLDALVKNLRDRQRSMDNAQLSSAIGRNCFPRDTTYLDAADAIAALRARLAPTTQTDGLDAVSVADMIARLDATPNWKREEFGKGWKDGVLIYDRAPFEAAVMLRKMRDEIASWRCGELCGPHQAELLEERAELRARAETAERALAECRAALDADDRDRPASPLKITGKAELKTEEPT